MTITQAPIDVHVLPEIRRMPILKAHRVALLLVAVSMVGATSRVARADTILTFTPACTAPAGLVNRGPTYSESGFTITSLFPASFLSSFCIGAPDFGGPALFVNLFNFNAVARLTANAGGTFSILSIDLGNIFGSNASPGPLTFTGRLSDGGVITQTFAFDIPGQIPPLFSTFVFNSTFTNLVSVDFAPQGDVTGTPLPASPYQFTNVRLNADTVAAEPATLLLLASGLAGLSIFVGVRGARRKERWIISAPHR
jgi:hypothetical protein